MPLPASLPAVETHYDVLGVRRKAPAEDIKRAYKQLALRHHPDRSDGSEEAFKRIAAAYEVLCDAASRAKYDSQLLERMQERREVPPQAAVRQAFVTKCHDGLVRTFDVAPTAFPGSLRHGDRIVLDNGDVGSVLGIAEGQVWWWKTGGATLASPIGTWSSFASGESRWRRTGNFFQQQAASRERQEELRRRRADDLRKFRQKQADRARQEKRAARLVAQLEVMEAKEQPARHLVQVLLLAQLNELHKRAAFCRRVVAYWSEVRIVGADLVSGQAAVRSASYTSRPPRATPTTPISPVDKPTGTPAGPPVRPLSFRSRDTARHGDTAGRRGQSEEEALSSDSDSGRKSGLASRRQSTTQTMQSFSRSGRAADRQQLPGNPRGRGLPPRARSAGKGLESADPHRARTPSRRGSMSRLCTPSPVRRGFLRSSTRQQGTTSPNGLRQSTTSVPAPTESVSSSFRKEPGSTGLYGDSAASFAFAEMSELRSLEEACRGLPRRSARQPAPGSSRQATSPPRRPQSPPKLSRRASSSHLRGSPPVTPTDAAPTADAPRFGRPKRNPGVGSRTSTPTTTTEEDGVGFAPGAHRDTIFQDYRSFLQDSRRGLEGCDVETESAESCETDSAAARPPPARPRFRDPQPAAAPSLRRRSPLDRRPSSSSVSESGGLSGGSGFSSPTRRAQRRQGAARATSPVKASPGASRRGRPWSAAAGAQ
eukprot:TRINITY_DN13720_c0_g5_i1.p1 TRINITY_DN13720_c0_g5~~TRINITY_DN13720_c0_g5_i1.p1  ORF type:complete len:738 (+),score=172.47 TRINITY_DN13720_c0_g5_i1:83-2215(+)